MRFKLNTLIGASALALLVSGCAAPTAQSTASAPAPAVAVAAAPAVAPASVQPAATLPHVVVLATGGTIAGAGASAANSAT